MPANLFRSVHLFVCLSISYRIAGNFHRTLFLEISETSGIFRNFLRNGTLKFFKPVAKKEKITENFEIIFLKYPLKSIF